jgi:mRNA interferase MazF
MMRGEIWWAEFGVPYGSEIGYSRPVLIVQDDAFNESKINTVVVLPLTTNLRLAEAPGNVFVSNKDSKLKKDSVVIVSQIYALDRTRLKERISKVNSRILAQVEIGVRLILGV